MARKKTVSKKKESVKKPLKKYFYALGRRKSSVATIRLFKGKDKSVINGIELEKLYINKSDRKILDLPFITTDVKGKYHYTAKVIGGGKSGQRDAIKLALSRALIKADSDFRTPLKKAGLLRVDSRVKERKKPGLKKARKKEQYSKR